MHNCVTTSTGCLNNCVFVYMDLASRCLNGIVESFHLATLSPVLVGSDRFRFVSASPRLDRVRMDRIFIFLTRGCTQKAVGFHSMPASLHTTGQMQ